MKRQVQHGVIKSLIRFFPVALPATGIACLAIGIAAQALGAPPAKPNIVLIMADDLGYGSLGCYGSKQMKTPHIDRLAAEGVRFTDFHSNGPMCSPTRAALLTGRYPQRCAWVDDRELSPVFRAQRKQNPAQRWAWGISNGELTIAGLLGRNGYRTGLVGKWHLGYDVAFHPMNRGFDEFRGFVGGNVDYHTHIAGYGLKQLDWWNGRRIENEHGYTTDLLTEHATAFIERNKTNPFFLYLAHAAPHVPWQGRDPHAKISLAATYQEMIGILDESVGKLTDTLHRHGLRDRTLLLFCSDNGAAPPPGVPANGRLQGRKGSMNEGGHRVPMIISWPGMIAPGSVCHDTVLTMDLFPTFAKLAGAAVPPDHPVDGIDLLPLLKGNGGEKERISHWLFGNAWAVRKGAWKLSGKAERPLALVNLDADLVERHNRLDEQPARAEELLQLHREWVRSVGDK